MLSHSAHDRIHGTWRQAFWLPTAFNATTHTMCARHGAPYHTRPKHTHTHDTIYRHHLDYAPTAHAAHQSQPSASTAPTAPTIKPSSQRAPSPQAADADDSRPIQTGPIGRFPRFKAPAPEPNPCKTTLLCGYQVASCSRQARNALNGAARSSQQQGIKQDGIAIPKIFRRARFARGASRPLLAGR
jgi:hypothetical protein